MKVKLFRAFPDPYRQSMTVYADALAQHFKDASSAGDEIFAYHPQGMFLSPPFFRYLSQYFAYQLLAVCHQGDVNHITDHSYGHLIHAMTGSKTIVTFHDAVGLKYQNGKSQKPVVRASLSFIQKYNLAGIRKAARVICVSQSGKRDFLQYVDYPEDRVKVIAEGVDALFYKDGHEDPRKCFGLDDARYILHLGHTQFYKNVPALFKLLVELKKRNRKVKLLKAGTSFTSEQTEQIREYGIEDQIVHLGILPREKIPALYRAADLTVIPSLDEGFGLPVLEAMASRLPVVASNRGALPEVLADAGILVDPENISSMADAVIKILEEPGLRQRLIENGKKRAQIFTWKKTVEETVALYHEVYAQAGKRGYGL